MNIFFDNSMDYQDKIYELIDIAENIKEYQYVIYRYRYEVYTELIVFGTEEGLKELLKRRPMDAEIKKREINEGYDVELAEKLEEEIWDALDNDEGDLLLKLANKLEKIFPDILDPLIVRAQAYEINDNWKEAAKLWKQVADEKFDKSMMFELYKRNNYGLAEADYFEAFLAAHIIYTHYMLDDIKGMDVIEETEDSYRINSNYFTTFLDIREELTSLDEDCLIWLDENFKGIEFYFMDEVEREIYLKEMNENEKKNKE